MDQVAFEKLAADAEELATTDFKRYKLNVAAYAMLGYLVIFAVLIAIVAIIGGLSALAVYSTAWLLILAKKKVLFLLIPMAWILLKALWVKVAAPTGYRLDRQQVPALFEELDALTSALKTTRVHQVLLTPELNAAVTQTPRLGIFGWQRNTLILGLELLLTLSPAQARAVLAHELGHLSGNHSAFNGWIYRIRQTWHRVMTAFADQDSIGANLMSRFFNWYVPRFSAYSFALARRNEYEADSVAAELTSATDAAEALVNVHVTAPYIDQHYWQDFFQKADEQAQPAFMPWTGLHSFVSGKHIENVQQRLDEALRETTGFEDTHPSLRDRLAALQRPAVLPKPAGRTAASAWLGSAHDSILDDFDTRWHEANQVPWQERFEYVQEGRAELMALNQKPAAELDDDSLWRRAVLTEEFDSTVAAIGAIGDYQQRHPKDPDAAFVLGRNLYEQKDEACLAAFELALSNRDVAPSACQYAYWFLCEQDRTPEAEPWRERGNTMHAENQAILAERQHLSVEDQLRSPNASADDAKTIISALEDCDLVKKAWLAEKVFEHPSDYVGYAVAVQCKASFQFDENALQQKLVEALPGLDAWLIPKQGEFKALAKHIIKAGAQVV